MHPARGHIVRVLGGASRLGQTISWIKSRAAKGAVLHADETSSRNNLHTRFEEIFSRLRRGEMGHHHHISGPHLLRYAQESAWREDNRKVSNGDQVRRVAGLALGRGKSVDFSGYWQRHKPAT